MTASKISGTTFLVATLVLFFLVASSAHASNAVRRRQDTSEERHLQAAGGVVSKLELINTETATPTVITDLTFGQVIDVAAQFGTEIPQLNINAVISGSVTSVRFGYNETARFSHEYVAPFAFCGDVKGARERIFLYCRQLGYGTHTVTATPITNGTVGPTVKVMFTVINSNLAPVRSPVTIPVALPVPAPVAVPVIAPLATPNLIGLRLLYTDTYPNVFVMNLQFGVVNIIDLQKLNLRDDDFNVEVLVGPNVKSVRFSNGRDETAKPLAYCGNDGDNFHTCDNLKVGTTTRISVTAYSGPYASGTAIGTRETRIQIIRSSAPVAPVAPVAAPIKVPVATPVRVPVPVSPPVAPVPGCPLPKLVGEWKKPNKPYPISVAEAQGTMIGEDFVITSGFKNGYSAATPETYALNMFNPAAEWRRMDDMPFPLGLTHLGVAVKGMKAYFCGGYVGGSLGIHNGSCFEYDHSVLPGNGQWTNFSSIPDGGRSGGGMIYDSTLDALVYSAGSQRPKRGSKGAIDFQTTWAYSLKNPAAGWVRKKDIPFNGNHMNFVTARDDKGAEHHFFFGGQEGDEEETGNTDEMYEYNAVSDVWIAKQSLPNPLGHAAASARAIGCGFLIAGGRTNTGLTDAILYYDIPTNQWTKIGELTHEIHTNVCAIGNGMLRCETGWATGTFSWTRGITL